MNQPTEQIKITGKGGKRPGAGRKKGIKTKAVLEREAVLKAFKDRVATNADTLFNAQVSLAKGIQYLFKTSVASKKPILVESPDEIAEYLDRLGNGETGVKDGFYYFITARTPDSGAIDSMLDRAFGKATQSVEFPSGLRIGKLDEIQSATKEILNG